jgi:hypothetical protein
MARCRGEVAFERLTFKILGFFFCCERRWDECGIDTRNEWRFARNVNVFTLRFCRGSSVVLNLRLMFSHLRLR